MIPRNQRVELDGVEIPRQVWRRDPAIRLIVRRMCTGAMAQVLLASGAFVPVIRIYTSGSGATETVPVGGANAAVACWGSGGGGGGGHGSGCTARTGGGGGGGGRAYTATYSIVLQGGNTFTYTVGAVGVGGALDAVGTDGGASSINAGTVTGWTNQTANGGHGGPAQGGTGGAGGTASGGGTSNTTGTTGDVGGQAGDGLGAAGLGTVISGDGAPRGGGGNGAVIAVSLSTNGLLGACVFSYT